MSVVAELQPLPADDQEFTIVPMLTTTRAVDLFLGDLTRRSRSKSGRTASSYRRLLDKFTDSLHGDMDVTEITPDDCRQFLDLYTRKSPGYQHTIYSTLNSFLEWLYKLERIKRNPLDHVARPRRIAPDDLDVTSVSTADVRKLLKACENDTEKITIAVLAYLGPRRNAVANLRLSDYDQHGGFIRFQEKGTKTILKPAPDRLRVLLDDAIARGALKNAWQPDDPYLIPPEGPLTRGAERDDRVIWRLVRRVAENAGVQAHVHALRAAFAVYYLEGHPGDLIGLQELLGHRSPESTRVYLRKRDKARSMEPVRTLSWADAEEDNILDDLAPQIAGKRFNEPVAMGAGGFEPPFAEPVGAGTPLSLPDDGEPRKPRRGETP